MYIKLCLSVNEFIKGDVLCKYQRLWVDATRSFSQIYNIYTLSFAEGAHIIARCHKINCPTGDREGFVRLFEKKKKKRETCFDLLSVSSSENFVLKIIFNPWI